MKTLFTPIILILLSGFNYCLAQYDTLITIFEFDAPSDNPWGLTYDGENLWISDDNTGKIYKTDPYGQVLDSIAVNNARIKGITFINDTLWVLNTMIMSDTVINTSAHPVYYLYKTDNLSGNKLDSIQIIGSSPSLSDGDLWGLCYYNSRIYISFNGGWGTCLLEINPNTEEMNEFCCTHLCGLENINDSIWAIRHNSMESTGNYIATVYEDKTAEIKKYDFNFYASDLTYDGHYFWLCDRDSKKIKQMGTIVVSNKMNVLQDNILKIYPNPSEDLIEIELSDNININEIRITDISGRIVKTIMTDNSCSKYNLDISGLKKGLYSIQLMDSEKSVTHKIIKQ